MPYTFLVGGARSGKSTKAVALAAVSAAPVTVVVTAEPRDDEMAERIRAHRATRPSDWTVVEAPLDLRDAVEALPADGFAIVDCLTLWVANALEAGSPPEAVAKEAEGLAAALAERAGDAVVVSNEVGLGIVPMHELARTYRDLLGRVNGIVADPAERAFFMLAGRGIALAEVLP